jgi:hypothetical protein
MICVGLVSILFALIFNGLQVKQHNVILKENQNNPQKTSRIQGFVFIM